MADQSKLPGSIDDAKGLMASRRDIPWLLRRQADAHPDKTFLIWEPFSGVAETWTYSRFLDDSLLLAGALAARGVEFGDRVLIHLDNSPEFLLSWFACAHLGAVAVSTNTRSVARDMEYFADHVQARCAITSPAFAALVSDNAPMLETLVVTTNDAGTPGTVPDGIDFVPFADLLAGSDRCTEREADGRANLGIQFTSGTTSRPKAVLWTHANAVWGAEVNVAHMRLRESDITLTFLPLFHTNAQSYSMLSTLWVGGTMVVQPRFSASRFWPVSVRRDITWCSTIPFCVKAAMSQELPSYHSYRFWGTAVRLPAVEKTLGIKTIGWWGMTETITQGIVSSYDQPGPDLGIGRASIAYEISIRREDGSAAQPGERGSLFIRGVRGVSLFKEYYLNEEATANSFDDDGWFETGDLIAIDDNGDLFFSDREKDMLKVGAENVAASEIEAVVMETGLAAEVAAVAQQHHMLDEVPVVFMIATPEAPDDVAELVMAACRENLADFKVPRAINLIDDFPRSTLEKIAKNELRALLPAIEAD